MTASPDITFDLAQAPLRELNSALHKATGESNARLWRVVNPNGRHAVAAGVNAPSPSRWTGMWAITAPA